MNPEYTIDNNYIEKDIDNLINSAISGMEIEPGSEIVNNTNPDTQDTNNNMLNI